MKGVHPELEPTCPQASTFAMGAYTIAELKVAVVLAPPT